MDFSNSEQAILDCYREKCRVAGQVKVGYQLRKRAMATILADETGVDLEVGLSDLAGKGLVGLNESGDRYYLTEAGAEVLDD